MRGHLQLVLGVASTTRDLRARATRNRSNCMRILWGCSLSSKFSDSGNGIIYRGQRMPEVRGLICNHQDLRLDVFCAIQ